MWIYDVEVLDVRILDPEVKMLVGDAQRNAMIADVHRRQEMLRLESERLKEEVNQAIYTSQIATLGKAVEHEETKRGLTLAQVESQLGGRGRAEARAARAPRRRRCRSARPRASRAVAQGERARARAARGARRGVQGADGRHAPRARGHAEDARQPEARRRSSRRTLSPLAILGGESVTDVVERLLGSLPLGTDGTVEKVLPAKAKRA